MCLWGRGVSRALTPSPATGQGPSFTELAPRRLPNTDMNLPQPPGPSSWFPHPKSLWPGPPQGCTPTHLETLPHRPQPEPVPEALPWHQAFPLPAHYPPRQVPQRARAQPAQPHSLADPAEALHEVLGEGKGEVGAGLVGTGWVAVRQLAGEVVPAETTGSLGLEWRGRRGEGQSAAAVFSHPAHSQAAGSAFSLLTASGP